jgi:hypothetical protein
MLWLLLESLSKWYSLSRTTPSLNSSSPAPSSKPSSAARSSSPNRRGGDSVEIGSIVIYAADPLLFCRMIVISITSTGLVECEGVHKDGSGTYPREVFNALELELASDWEQATA